MLTWAQLGLHQKPCGLLNVEGYYDHLISLFNHGVTEQFIRPQHRSLVLEEKEPLQLLDLLAGYKPLLVDKWINRNET